MFEYSSLTLNLKKKKVKYNPDIADKMTTGVVKNVGLSPNEEGFGLFAHVV